MNLDATAPITIATGIGFFDHMLEQLAKHGGFSLELKCHGDLEIDEHHTVEDCALALGEALRMALGDKVGIARYGFVLPMDEAQVRVAIDLSGRAYGVFEGKFAREAVGGLPTELVPHFFTLAGRESQGRGPCHHHRREHAPHDRSLLQGSRPRAAPGVSPRRRRAAVDQGSAVSAAVAIIDSGGANIASLRAALARLGADSVVTSDPGVIQRAPRVLLPGVGSAHDAMARLRGTGLDKLIPTLKQPLLGICLGMQILFETSEEGPANGLAVIPGNVGKLQFAPGLPVPHMGWNQLSQTQTRSAARRRELARLRVLRARLRRARRRLDRRHHRLRQPLHRGGAPRQFLRHAIPPRTLGRGRRAHPRQLSEGKLKQHDPHSLHRSACRPLRAPAQGQLRRGNALRPRAARTAAALSRARRELAARRRSRRRQGRPARQSQRHRAARLAARAQHPGGRRRAFQAVVDDLLRNGIDRVIVGSAAVETPAEVQGWLKRYGAEKIGLAFDIRHDAEGVPRVLTRGWTKESKLTLWEAIESYLPHGLKHVLCTDAELDGALQGPAVALYAEGVKRYPQIAWQASGGVRSAADLAALAAIGSAAAISGKALLEEMIDPTELGPFLPNASSPASTSATARS